MSTDYGWLMKRAHEQVMEQFGSYPYRKNAPRRPNLLLDYFRRLKENK